jgi:hypothetical protein
MADLARLLALQLSQTVQDQTASRGFRFQPGMVPGLCTTRGPCVYDLTTVEEKLGLKLRPQKFL